ncbi:DUF488 domain-containing protein [Methylobacterium sp. C25]|uniref:hypothetical protein n=1 Tax=Methylobacterium sp. C25 TaxID=2721622 RepID=UPI001F2729B3|nr:hypothetical protein [Methylobacterium sp. C25]MCE4223633.1 DUF488 domain-containing protein [Methylobacterium sp. C25]
MILTSHWFAKLPRDHIKIGVSSGTPSGFKHLPRIAELAPGPYFRTADAETYRSRYVTQLAQLDPTQIVDRIDQLAQGQTPVLVCWERPGTGDWCHRAWISVWLAHRLGLIVEEFGLEGRGFGASHPMLPEEYRRPQSTPVPTLF